MLKNEIFNYYKSFTLNDKKYKSSLYYIQNKKILVFQNNFKRFKYVFIPDKVKFLKKKINYIFYLKNYQFHLLKIFSSIFNRSVKNIDSFYFQKLLLKGLGLKIYLMKKQQKSVLSFKLGLSHKIEYIIPKHKITCYLKKNNIVFKSFDLNFLGNFCKTIKLLKPVNVFTGKGFWYKNEKVKIKKFKKLKKKLKKR